MPRKAWRSIRRLLGRPAPPAAGKKRATSKAKAATASSGAAGASSSGGPPVPRKMKVVLVGGTGRSGTTVTGRLLGAHPDYAMVPVEARFLTDADGLCDLAKGQSTFEAFERRLRASWYPTGSTRRLDAIADEATIATSLARLREELESDPWAAARGFTHRLFDPIAEAAGAIGWVEMTPGNVRRVGALQRMLRGSRLVHTFRDGRDVACSVVRLPWGPRDPDDGLDWWARGLRRAFERAASAKPERVLHVQMEEFILRDRDAQYARLVEFLGRSDAPEMRAYFDQHMTPDNLHAGRWLRDVPPERLAAFEQHHERLAAELQEGGWPYQPLTKDEVLARAG